MTSLLFTFHQQYSRIQTASSKNMVLKSNILGDEQWLSPGWVKGPRVQGVPKWKFREIYQGHSVYVHHLTSSYQETPVATGQNNALLLLSCTLAKQVWNTSKGHIHYKDKQKSPNEREIYSLHFKIETSLVVLTYLTYTTRRQIIWFIWCMDAGSWS